MFPYIVIFKIVMSVFKDFELNIVINIIYRYEVNSLAPLPLTFTDLLMDVYYTV